MTDAAKDANALIDGARTAIIKHGISENQILFANLEMLEESMAGVFLTVKTTASNNMALIAESLKAEPVLITFSSGFQIQSQAATVCPADGCSVYTPTADTNSSPCPLDSMKHFEPPTAGNDRVAIEDPTHAFALPGDVPSVEFCADVCIDRTDCVAFQYKARKKTGKGQCHVIIGTVEESVGRKSSNSNWEFFVRALTCARQLSIPTISPGAGAEATPSVTTTAMLTPATAVVTTSTVKVPSTNPEYNVSVDPNVKISENEAATKFTNDHATTMSLSVGTLVAIIVVGLLVLAIPVVCYVARKKGRKDKSQQQNSKKPKPPTSPTSPTSPWKPNAASEEDNNVENWNFDTTIDDGGVGVREPDEDGLTWDGEGLRLWDRDNSVKVGPRALSLKSGRSGVNTARSVKLQADGAWVPVPPKQSNVHGHSRIGSASAGAGNGRGRRGRGGQHQGSTLNPYAKKASILKQSYVKGRRPQMPRPQLSGKGSMIDLQSQDNAAPVYQQRFDTRIQDRFGSEGYGREGMIRRREDEVVYESVLSGVEDEVGYANHGDLGMLPDAQDHFNMMDTSFAEEIDTFSSETDGAPNVQELYSMAMGRRPSARPGTRIAAPMASLELMESESDYDHAAASVPQTYELAEFTNSENDYQLAGSQEAYSLAGGD